MTNVNRNEAMEAPAAKASGTRASKKMASPQQPLVDEVTQIARRTFRAAASSVLLLDKKDGDLIFEVASGQVGKQLRGTRLGAQYGIAGWVVRHNKPLLVNDVSKDWRFDEIVDTVTGFTTSSLMCAPLVVRRKVIGVIEVLNKLDGTNFSDNDLESLASLASMAALTINNARLHSMIMTR